MFKIVRFPSKLQPFFSSLTKEFHWDHDKYFSILVLLICFSWERRNIAALYRYLDRNQYTHRSRFNNFLNLGRWNPEKALQQKAYELLYLLRPGAEDVLYLCLDDSKKDKRGTQMEAVGWLYDPVSGKKIKGHQYVQAIISFHGVTIPFAVRLYVKHNDCARLGMEFKKLTRLAAELIESFTPPAGLKVIVLFDSYYLCPAVVNACRAKKFTYVSTLKSNRNLFKNGRKLKAGTYGKHLLKSNPTKKYCLKKPSGTVRFSYGDAGWMSLSGIGTAQVVYSRKNKEKNMLPIVSNDPSLSARQMIQAYLIRWSIEVFFKDTKQHLGLGQYQNGTCRAAVMHLHLVCFAYALLTHIAITGECAQAKKNANVAARPTTSSLQNELRRIVWDDLVDYLKELPSGDSVVKELSRLLVAA